MAFNVTSAVASVEFHCLVDICLDSTTLRIADADVSLRMGASTGAFYEGRLVSPGTVVRDLGTFLEAKEQLNTFALPIDDRDHTIRTVFWNATFANREVKLWIGSGDDIDDYSLAYAGLIEFPGGVEFDDTTLTVNMVDRRIKDRRLLPLSERKYTTATYPHLEMRSRTKAIPILYGDWSSAAASGISVPCVCIDTTVPRFQVAGHGISGIDRYLLNAAVISPSNVKNVNLAAGTFELDSVAYDATLDIVSVNCKGLYTANGTLIQSPGAVLRSLHTTYVGLTADNLDVTAYHSVDTYLDGVKLRRFIETPTESDQLVQELLNETQIDMRFVGGKYSPKYRFLDVGVERMRVTEEDIVEADGEQAAFDWTVRFDPDRLYCNKIPAKWQYNPIDAKFLSATTLSSTFAIERDRTTVERAMDFYWLWDQAQVESRVGRELVIFSTQPVYLEGRMGKRLMRSELADQVDIEHDVFTSKTFQIRRTETNLQDMTVRVSAYNLFSDVWGSFTSDSAPNWAAANDLERREQGFWCDDDGLAESADPNSDWSRYY